MDPIGEQTLSTIRERARNVSLGKIELDKLSEAVFSYIYTEQKNYFEATHSGNPRRDGYAGEVIFRYKALENQINDFLDTKLTRSREGDPLLFGQPLDSQKLSDGQIILLHVAIALHAREKSLKDVIIFMDEPENHLHSAILIEVVDRLLSKVGNGQIFICTHSIPLVAHLASIDPFSIWYLGKDGVKRAGQEPESILKGLMGSEAAINGLFDFLKLPRELAAANYASQCLLPPQVVSSSAKTDPQLHQIATYLQEQAAKEGRPVRILDYGAGKGRILSGLHDRYSKTEGPMSKHVEYYAFEPMDDGSGSCQKVIDSVYDASEQRYFSDFEKIKAAGLKFDVVALTNVLHEIHPDQWGEIFSREGIPAILSDSGSLLLVEDHHLPVGERAHEFGFILLDTSELKLLFDVGLNDEENRLFRFADAKGDGRLKAHVIHRSLVEKFTTNTQFGAYESLRRRALVELTKLRKLELPNYSIGQRLGLWTQLFANTSLFFHSQEATNRAVSKN
ncbi:hypothetical protein UB44_17660 [Burkholderiaceae bacterium 26]|nr:hypothetical protein UB44_17660 [Burkholderiaceae bacterium 26]